MDILVLSGPTASGKSKLALKLAHHFNGVIINADSMQCYKEIPIITASPTSDDKKLILHYLYNYISVYEDQYSVGKYINDVIPVIKNNISSGKLSIITGGTGLYINALTQGIHPIPDITPQTKNYVRQLYQSLGKEEFYNLLLQQDHYALTTINPNDQQRMIRAYEIILQTGNPITYYYQHQKQLPLTKYRVTHFTLLPSRELLYDYCNQRVTSMINCDAIEEIRQLYPYHLQMNPSAKKALGVPQIISYLKQEMSLEAAIEQIKIKTRQYAKRQLTWIRCQFSQSKKLFYNTQEEFSKLLDSVDDIINF